jgi:hypothetical protein
MRDLISIAALVCFGLVDDLDPDPGPVDGLDPDPGLVDDFDLMGVVAAQVCSAGRGGSVVLAWAAALGGCWVRDGCSAAADRRVCCLDLGGERAAWLGDEPAAWLVGGSRFREDGFREDGC